MSGTDEINEMFVRWSERQPDPAKALAWCRWQVCEFDRRGGRAGLDEDDDIDILLEQTNGRVLFRTSGGAVITVDEQSDALLSYEQKGGRLESSAIRDGVVVHQIVLGPPTDQAALN